jgi:hypothetical protein
MADQFSLTHRQPSMFTICSSHEIRNFMANQVNSSSIPLAELRRIMEAAAGAASHRPMLPFGIKEIDEALPGGGLALGAVHEFSEEGPRGGYAACALLFDPCAAARAGSLVPVRARTGPPNTLIVARLVCSGRSRCHAITASCNVAQSISSSTVIQRGWLCGIDVDFVDQSLFLFASRAHEPARAYCQTHRTNALLWRSKEVARIYCDAPQG